MHAAALREEALPIYITVRLELHSGRYELNVAYVLMQFGSAGSEIIAD